MNEPLISLHEVGICYRRAHGFFKGARSEFWALKNVSFSVRQGETIGVLGRNGAGKSTLMRVLAGIIAPDRGRLEMRRGLRSNLLSIGVGSHSTLSGRENAILNGMMLGASKQKMLGSLERIREFSELGNFFEEPIYSYSSGMAARLGFATALEVDPDVMLIDEMLSVGDSSFRQKSAQALKDRLRNGKTAVLVSHDSATITDLCNRVVWIEHGVSIAEGEAGKVALDYEATMAAGGHMQGGDLPSA
jgi:lipopolysaccharide transport system ATP-binding protein